MNNLMDYLLDFDLNVIITRSFILLLIIATIKWIKQSELNEEIKYNVS